MFGSFYVLFISKCWNRISLLMIRNIRSTGKTSKITSSAKIYPSSSSSYSPSSKTKGGPHGKSVRMNSLSKPASTLSFTQLVLKRSMERSRQVFLLSIKRRVLQNPKAMSLEISKSSWQENQEKWMDKIRRQDPIWICQEKWTSLGSDNIFTGELKNITHDQEQIQIDNQQDNARKKHEWRISCGLSTQKLYFFIS